MYTMRHYTGTILRTCSVGSAVIWYQNLAMFVLFKFGFQEQWASTRRLPSLYVPV